MIRLLALGLFLLINTTTSAQDLIIRINNDTIRALVVDITKNKVKFIYNDVIDAQIFELNKSLVKQIVFENGSKLTIITNPYEVSSDKMIPEHPHAVKIEVFSAALNHFTIAFEKKIRKGRSIEIKGGLIATNVNTTIDHAEGYFIKGGLKFIRPTESYMKGLKYTQPLEGAYVKPEIIFSQYTGFESQKKINYTNYAFNVIFGKQKVWNNKFVMDYFAGLGFGILNSSKDVDFTYSYSHLYFGKEFPLIISGGFLLGIAF